MQLKKIKMRTGQVIQYGLFRLLCFILNLLPFAWALQLGRWVGRSLYYILSKYRNVSLENLHFAFREEKSESEIRKIAIQSFENLGYFAIEFIRIPKILSNIQKYIVIKNDEPAFGALKLKKGMIFIVSHFGNWEWMAVLGAKRAQHFGAQMNAVARVFGNPYLYRYITKNLRGATGLNTIDKRGGARQAMKHLEQNEVVCILIDQHERYGSVPVPYFGRDAWTTSLPAVLAVKKGVPVFPVFSFRTPGKPTVLEVGKAFPVIRTGDYEKDIIENTAQYIRSIQEVVRKRPGDWLWMHGRWRSSRTSKGSRVDPAASPL